MGQANNDTKAIGHSASLLLYQTSLKDDRLFPYIEAIAGSTVALRTPLLYTIHNSTQLVQSNSITSSKVISSSRGFKRVSLSSTVASNPKLLQSFVKSKVRRMPNLVI